MKSMQNFILEELKKRGLKTFYCRVQPDIVVNLDDDKNSSQN